MRPSWANHSSPGSRRTSARVKGARRRWTRGAAGLEAQAEAADAVAGAEHVLEEGGGLRAGGGRPRRSRAGGAGRCRGGSRSGLTMRTIHRMRVVGGADEVEEGLDAGEALGGAQEQLLAVLEDDRLAGPSWRRAWVRSRKSLGGWAPVASAIAAARRASLARWGPSESQRTGSSPWSSARTRLTRVRLPAPRSPTTSREPRRSGLRACPESQVSKTRRQGDSRPGRGW
jgi:hypothetical protein